MTEADLLALFLDVNQDIDTQFQFWISITFAVLVASFVAGERLSRAERLVVTVLYLFAATIVFFRYLSALTYVQEVLELYATNGLPLPTVASVAGVLRMVLFTFGSLAAALSVLFPRFGVKGDGERFHGAGQGL